MSAFLQRGAGERDGLDSFVLAGVGGGELAGSGGGLQVEDVLNELIPDGECYLLKGVLVQEGGADTRVLAENALAQAGLVSLLLRAKIQEIRLQVEELTRMLEEDQDPDKMSLIQELIGVRARACFLPSERTG